MVPRDVARPHTPAARKTPACRDTSLHPKVGEEKEIHLLPCTWPSPKARTAPRQDALGYVCHLPPLSVGHGGQSWRLLIFFFFLICKLIPRRHKSQLYHPGCSLCGRPPPQRISSVIPAHVTDQPPSQPWDHPPGSTPPCIQGGHDYPPLSKPDVEGGEDLTVLPEPKS